MIVIDASAVVELLLRTPAGISIEALLFAPGQSLHAPELLYVEVAHVLRRGVLRGRMSASRGGLAIADLRAMRVRHYPHVTLLQRVWALRDNLSAYDATYVALAEELDAPLFTRDSRLALAPGHRATVTVV